MLKMEQKMKKEQMKLDDLISMNNYELVNEKVLEQSRKLDKIIIIYQKVNFTLLRTKKIN